MKKTLKKLSKELDVELWKVKEVANSVLQHEPEEHIIEVRFRGTIKYDKEANVYVAHTPELNIFSQGETVLQARQALEDAIESVFIVSRTHSVPSPMGIPIKKLKQRMAKDG